MPRIQRIQLQPESLVLLVSAFLLLFANQSFWHRVGTGLGPVASAWGSYLGVVVLVYAVLCLLLGLLTPRLIVKPVLTLFLVIAAGAAYFMDHYGAIIDRHALQSALESDARESAEWLSTGMVWTFVLLALLPSLAIGFLVECKPRSWRKAVLARLGLLLGAVVLIAATVSLNFPAFASLARNHTDLRDLFNPLNVINATRAHLKKYGREVPAVPLVVGGDVRRGKTWGVPAQKPVLLLVVVGESVRASSFGLLGHDPGRDTTPELRQLPLTLFREVHSCGTNTATSVPCMFSNMGRSTFDEWQAKGQENLLDVLVRAGFAVEWIDNNTGSKDVAARVPETDVAHRTDPEFCNADGCHDDILLASLAPRLQALRQTPRDSVIVLHQLGSHGPAYFQRYPKEFARFQPICESVDLQACSTESLRNSYDNTVAFTDHVVASMIQRLQAEAGFDTALLYVSDHGESTGENGLYLHGAPYSLAPTEQTRVPMFWWFSDAFLQRRLLDRQCLQDNSRQPTSHDAVFPMVLHALDLVTDAYQARLDPLRDCG